MGFLSDQNRPVRLEQVSTGEDDAIPGVHYVSFDDPDFTRLCFVPANQNRTQVPVIAGGLLRDKADVMAAMRAGAAAVSTSAPSLWDI